MAKKILIVEDDPGLQSQLRWFFNDFEVLLANDQKSAIQHIQKSHPPVVTLDLGLPPDPGGVTVGFNLLQQILSQAPGTKIIVITGQEDRDNALKAIGMGAYDYFNKPVDAETLSLVVDRAWYLHRIEQENRELQEKYISSPLDGIIATSPSILNICKTIEKIAPSDLSVLILGESGTGKEVFARAIHNLSEHAKGRFVAINCAAIPESLLESELFGHEKGSFTGATAQKIGKIEVANEGTLFLDEIGDMPMDLQAKLLRFLQERVIERVGGTKEIPINTRIICATHKPIKQMIEEHKFREDLYYRINDITLELPPLRERDDDILVLAQAFIEKYAHQHNKQIHSLSAEAKQMLISYECKGNVRELDKIIRRAVIMCNETYINSEDLDIDFATSDSDDDEDITITNTYNLKKIRSTVEKRTIIRALKESKGNVSTAAKLLEITRPTFYSMCDKLGIEIQDF